MKTLFVLLDKEIRQFFRNAFLPKLVIVFPVMVILIIPWVTTMDVRHIGVSVVDNDHSETSRRIIQKIEASDYFNLRGVTESYDDSFPLAAFTPLSSGTRISLFFSITVDVKQYVPANNKRVSVKLTDDKESGSTLFAF